VAFSPDGQARPCLVLSDPLFHTGRPSPPLLARFGPVHSRFFFPVPSRSPRVKPELGYTPGMATFCLTDPDPDGVAC